MPKRICFVSAFYPPHIGGVERYVSELAGKFREKGYDVYVITSSHDNSKVESEIDGIRVFRLKSISLLGGRLPIPLPNKSNYEIIRNIKEIQPSDFILNMRIYPLSILGMILGNQSKAKIHLIEHVTGKFELGNPVKNFLSAIYEWKMTFFLKMGVDAFYGVSGAAAEWLKQWGIKAKGVIYNGINPDYDYPDESDYIPHKSDDEIFITAGGRLLKEKGYYELCRAFAKVSVNYPNAKLIVAGDGPEYKSLVNKFADEQIIFIGPVPHRDMMYLLKQSEIVVIPSYYPEGLPTFILEAGISNCALITTSMGGTREVITNNENGIIIPPRSETAISDAIEMLISQPGLRKTIAESLNQKVSSQFNWDLISAELGKRLLSNIN